ncbi:hypothetical protein GW17_00061445, partial [Ensete ventricosum]
PGFKKRWSRSSIREDEGEGFGLRILRFIGGEREVEGGKRDRGRGFRGRDKEGGGDLRASADAAKAGVLRRERDVGSRTLVGVDKVGNRYFTRVEEIDGISKPTLNLFFWLASRIH